MRMKHFLLAVAALVVSLTASAQGSNSFAQDHLSLSGYLQGGFQSTESSSTFYLKRARVSLTGNAKEEKIDYRLQVDMAGSPKICDLYFRYKPSSQLGMQIGQFKMPFAIENDIYGPTTVELIDYSYITTLFARNNNQFDGIAATGRDIGFQIYGGFGEEKGYKTLSYNLGVFNGTGINVADNNDSKDIVARLILKPSKALSLSGSVMTTKTTKVTSELKLSGHSDAWDLLDIKLDTVTTKTNINSNRWSVGVIYDVEDFIVRSEYASAEFENGDNINSFYALGGYKLKNNWMLIARYETLSEVYKSTYDTYRNRVTLGAVYKPYSFLRFQLNYSYEKSGLQSVNKYDSVQGVNLMLTAIF